MSSNESTQPPQTTEDRLGGHGDAMYAALLQAHAGLSDEQSARLNSRLVLLLMNQLADPDIFDQVLQTAGSIDLANRDKSV